MSDGGATQDEAARLATLHRLELLDTAPEPAFDDIVQLARAITGAQTALISLVDADRQWFKARIGLDAAETPRSVAFCDHTIRRAEVMVTLDASRDPRFAANPLVTGPPFIRFYAGAPLRTAEGHALGTVCVLDPRPRTHFDEAEALAALARQAAGQIELRRLATTGADAHAAAARDRDRLWTLAHDIILVSDLDNHVLAANPAWQAVFGPVGAPGSVSMADFLVEPDGPRHGSSIADGEAFPLTRKYRGQDGAVRTISWTLRREGELIYGIGRDDTVLRATEAELIQAQKMESLGQLTGGIAHDFNNLLTIILGNLDIAGRRLAQGDAARVTRALSAAQEGATRAATLTQRLLAFARRQRLAPRAIDPGLFVADMRALIEHAAGDRIMVELFAEAGLWPIEIDTSQLENAVLNLAVNACDAMAGNPEGGTLLVRLANVTVAAADAARHGVPAGEHMRLTVADTGTGMSEEVRTRAFEPFFTTKGVGRGTGLGLSHVHGFVSQSGGFVTIETQVGQGSAVHLWLPRGREAPVDAGIAVPEIVPPGHRAATVMVVEDNDALRELAVETLRDAGYRVIEAHDGRSALSLFARQNPPPELIVSDVMMPRLDGFALAAEIRARTAATRILLMSGYAGQRPGGGGEQLLVKPFTPTALLDRVRALLGE